MNEVFQEKSYFNRKNTKNKRNYDFQGDVLLGTYIHVKRKKIIIINKFGGKDREKY